MLNNNQQRKLQRPTFMQFRIPEAVFIRLGGKETQEEALWICDTCGTIEPTSCLNGFIPGKCPCQEAKQEEERMQQERLKIWKERQQVLALHCQKCYTWLGPQWSEPALSDRTFATFDHTLQSKAFFAAFEFSERLLAGTYPGNIIFYSTTYGTGKTHLAAAICNSLITRMIPCLFATGQNIFNAFGTRFDAHQGADDLIALASNTPLLVIDDLSNTHSSVYKQGIFFNILNQRNLKKLPTLITTNAEVIITPFEILGLTEYIGGAACSRLKEHGLQIIEMKGEIDYRHKLGQQSWQ